MKGGHTDRKKERQKSAQWADLVKILHEENTESLNVCKYNHQNKYKLVKTGGNW